MNIEINKGKGIEGPVSGYVPIEEERTIETEDSALKQALEGFDNDWIDAAQLGYSIWPPPYGKTELLLTPDQISAFWMTILTDYNQEGSSHLENMGTQIQSSHVNSLIQNSYDAGNNRFTLHTNTPVINGLGYTLRVAGTEEKPIKIKLTGDTQGMKISTEHAEVDIEGDAGLIFADNCTITIQGDVYTGHGDGSGYRVDGVKGNLFRSPNKTTIKKISGKFPLNNRLILLQPDGTEKKVYMTTGRAWKYWNTFWDYIEDDKR